MRLYFSLLVVFSLFVSQCHAGCSEVDSLTEAVAGEGFLLGCISCKRREEVPARATVDWHFKPLGEEEFRHIFHYDHPVADILHEDFSHRLVWRGTLNDDIQMGTVYVNNVTFNDTGTYRCTFHRTLFLPLSPELVTVEKEVELSVVTVGKEDGFKSFSKILLFQAVLQKIFFSMHAGRIEEKLIWEKYAPASLLSEASLSVPVSQPIES
uniref:Sodium channel regulatory subunit beta-3 n=1 Tax=Haplochromis burtoni TaxID=8153 RepID=A0A3Q2WGP5_HAPBU